MALFRTCFPQVRSQVRPVMTVVQEKMPAAPSTSISFACEIRAKPDLWPSTSALEVKGKFVARVAVSVVMFDSSRERVFQV